MGPFAGWLRGAVIQCKYHGEWARVSQLAPLLGEVCQTLGPCDALVPVPLHSSRLRQRGFNQSLLLALGVADLQQIPVEACLVRTRRTDSQTQLTAEERRRNLTGAMALAADCTIADRRVVLIDDVITTGSTLAACAEVLEQAGARWVKAATICREL